MSNNKPLRVFAAFLIGFFLVIALLTALVVIPQINKSLEIQYIKDSEVTLEIETELLRRFITNHVKLLKDLASFPVITNAVLLSTPEEPNFVDLVDNFSIQGQKARLVLQDIAGDIMYKTDADIKGSFANDAVWIEDLLQGKSQYNFQLLPQDNDIFQFIISIPVTYLGNIEGIMSAEISAPIDQVFSAQRIEAGEGFRLTQKDVVVQTDVSRITVPREISDFLEKEKLELVYIRDDFKVLEEQNKLRNTILIVLFFGLGLSFLLFVVLGYRSFEDAQETKNIQKSIFDFSYILPLGLGLIGIATSLAAAFLLLSLQQQQERQSVLAKSRLQILAVEKKLQGNLDVLTSLRAFYDASNFVDREEFRSFSGPILKNHDAIQAVEWIPRVARAKRDAFEIKAREDGLSEFKITERNAQGQLVSSSKKDSYFPVFYVEPRKGNEKAIGYDLASHPKRQKALKKASSSGKAVATAPIKLVQESEEQAGVLVFYPVYEKDHSAHDGHDYLENHLKGFVLSVIRMGDVVNFAQGEEALNTSLFIEDITDEKSPQTIFGAPPNPFLSSALVSEDTIFFASRIWRITAFPGPGLQSSHSSYILPWVVLISGIIFSTFISYTFIQLVRRRQIIEAIVEDRTKEVKELSLAMERTVEGVSKINPEGRYVYVNEAYASMSGYKMDELLGSDWQMTIHEEDTEAIKTAYQYMLDRGKSLREVRGVRKDGSVFYISMSMISRYDDDHNFIGHHCFMSDVTKRKKAEESLKQANEELEEFAYRTSHDLRSPLISSIKLLELTEQFIHDDKKDKATEAIELSTGSLKKLETLVSDILSLTQTKNAEEKTQTLSVKLVVEEALEKLHHMDGLDKIEIQKDLQAIDEIAVKPSRFRLIVENLISNAIKYSDGEKKKSFIKISSQDLEGYFTLSIEDNGLGIPKSNQKQLFSMFKRFHTKVSYGSGLGLYMIKKSANILGGEMQFEDTGDGSRFILKLPLSELGK